MNWRMLPPTNVAHQTRVVNGRTYTGAPGTSVSVPDVDGPTLQANGWTFIALSGTTSARPSSKLGVANNHRGTLFFDETLSALIITDGTTWRNPATGASV